MGGVREFIGSAKVSWGSNDPSSNLTDYFVTNVGSFANSGSIISLSLYFENEFILCMNQLYLHLKLIDVNPVVIAGEWMADLFVGQINTNEVLYLVDRMLGFESLLLLPILSLGIFKHYEHELLGASSIEDVEAVLFLGDIEFIKTVNKVLKEIDTKFKSIRLSKESIL